ncbi:MAG: ABC transporter ATP-binding protein [Oscillospiraceae bacterium]|nr:ABC transporter ATP-binding protein [Oscillospiraceae bacterium]
MIDIKNLTRDYGNNRGVFDLTLHIPEGEVFGFIGPNGAGKTTTIRHLMGFLFPDVGNCKIGGLNCWQNANIIQKNLGYIAGEIAFFNDLTGPQFLKFMAEYRKLGNLTRMNELLERFELNPRGKIKKMSKGMKQKIGIVAAFMHAPAVLILDEPTSGLDPLMQNKFIELIHEEKARGKTILMSSHIFEEVERTCDRVGIIKDGRLVALDTVANLKAMQTKKYVITFENLNDIDKFTTHKFQSKRLSDNRLEVILTDELAHFLHALTLYKITNLSAPNQNLEDIFMAFYGDKEVAADV